MAIDFPSNPSDGQTKTHNGKTWTYDSATTSWIFSPTSSTETDPVVGAVSGIVKSDGSGNITNAVAGTDYLSSYTETDTLSDVLSRGNTTSTDIDTTGKVYFSNVFNTEQDLPSATTYHGMFAHVHGTASGYFAHSNSWTKLANHSDLYTNADVNTLLDQANATSGEVLSWDAAANNGSGGYSWVAQSGGGGTSLWTESGNNVYYDSGDVGIGTSTPSAKLQIDIPEYDSNTHDSDPVSSLVVGYGSQSLGHSCISIGRNTTSGKDDGDGTFSGHHSVAMGAETTASGDCSTAMGISTTASGSMSTAMGQETEATGQSSTAMGYKTKAIGINSTAMGEETVASGKNSTAMGEQSEASGQWSTAIGAAATASNQYCTSIGSYTTASALRSTAMGHNIQVNGMYSFGIGLNLPDEVNGVQYHTISQDNTMAIMGGNVGIGTVTPSENLEVDGAIKLGTTTTNTAGTMKWTGTDFEGNVNGTWKSLTSGGAGGSLQSRTTIDTSAMQITSGSSTIAANSSASGHITGYKAYSLFKVSINDPDLWVTIYTDNTSMTNDSARLYTEDPPPGSGVIAEFISNTSNQDIIVSPTTIGFNMDSTVGNNIYLKVQNIGSSDSTFSIELTILQLEQ